MTFLPVRVYPTSPLALDSPGDQGSPHILYLLLSIGQGQCGVGEGPWVWGQTHHGCSPSSSPQKPSDVGKALLVSRLSPLLQRWANRSKLTELWAFTSGTRKTPGLVSGPQ